MQQKCERSRMRVPGDRREGLCAPGGIGGRGERSGMGHIEGHIEGGDRVGAGERSGGAGHVEGRRRVGGGEHAQRS